MALMAPMHPEKMHEGAKQNKQEQEDLAHPDPQGRKDQKPDQRDGAAEDPQP